MIGNDIVDFQKAALESNWLREGYLDKLFCKEEKELILDSKNPHQMVWLLWTMKEAGYKIHFRQKFRCYHSQSIQILIHWPIRLQQLQKSGRFLLIEP